MSSLLYTLLFNKVSSGLNLLRNLVSNRFCSDGLMIIVGEDISPH